MAYGSNVISISKFNIWTSGGAREFELETPNLVWLLFTVSSISVPNFTTFPQSVLWAAIHFRRKKEEKKKKKKNNNANKHNRCLRTFGAWPLIITPTITIWCLAPNYYYYYKKNYCSRKVFCSFTQAQTDWQLPLAKPLSITCIDQSFRRGRL